MVTIVPIMNWLSGLPIYSANLHHLWFLWHLCWLVAGFALVVLMLRRLPLRRMPAKWILSPARYLWLVPLTMIPTAMMAGFGPDTSSDLIPMVHVLGYYAIFFGFGALHYDKGDPYARIGRRWWLVLPIGIVFIFPLGLTLDPDVLQIPKVIPVFFQAVYPWAMTFGLIGLFLRVVHSESPRTRYVSDSSYWLYLVHLPLIIVAQKTVREWPIPAVTKLVLICVVATAILLLMYQVFVRYSWLGTLLNGPRERPLRAVAKATD
jgi:peptidoglycan/LPS O-acetylase OafA/YrhL